MLCFRVLTDYLHLLEDWKVRYAPKTPDEPYDDRFVEACQMHCHIEYMADDQKKCLSPAKKYKFYKSSINKSIHFVQRSLSSSPR